MAMIISESEKKDFIPNPMGVWQAVCVDMIDKGMVDTAWGRKHKVQLRWQTTAEYTEKDEKTNQDIAHRYLVIKPYTYSLDEKANLRKDLEAWRGKKFQPEDFKDIDPKTGKKGFDLERLIGANCQLGIVHVESADGSRVYANISAILPLSKDQKKMVALDYVRVKDRPVEGETQTDNDESPDGDGLPF